MYIYTDDDLTRINRDYLGPKGKRLPWVATYRTYVVVGAVATGIFGLFLFLGVPLNQWTVLLYLFLCALVVTYAIRRLNRDVSLYSMFKAGWQEVNVPRAGDERPKSYQIKANVQRFAYDAMPGPYWWQKALAAVAQPFGGRHTTGDKTTDKTADKKPQVTKPTAKPAVARRDKKVSGTEQRASRRKP